LSARDCRQLLAKSFNFPKWMSTNGKWTRTKKFHNLKIG